MQDNLDAPWALDGLEATPVLENLGTLHAAIEAGLRAAFPDMASVQAYPSIGREIETPCIVIEMSEMEPGHDPGTGQAALVGRFQARVILAPFSEDAEIAVREQAARIAKAVHAQTWGLPVTAAKLVTIAEDPFDPRLDTYLVWLVEWTHEFDLSDAMPALPPGGACVQILWGVAPQTGPGHESSYFKAASDSPATEEA